MSCLVTTTNGVICPPSDDNYNKFPWTFISISVKLFKFTVLQYSHCFRKSINTDRSNIRRVIATVRTNLVGWDPCIFHLFLGSRAIKLKDISRYILLLKEWVGLHNVGINLDPKSLCILRFIVSVSSLHLETIVWI